MRYGFIILMIYLISGCADYAVTFNNKSIITPIALYQSKKIIDNALRNCIEHTIVDQKITDPKTLKVLDCSHAGIVKLDGIQQFLHLSEVRLKNNSLEGIAPLLLLDKLTLADLNNNANIDCDDLTQLRNRGSIKSLLSNTCE